MSTYKVNYERDEAGWWMASVVGVDGCRTQGRTIKQARTRIREALKLFVRNADRAQLVDRVQLPQLVREALKRRDRARSQRELFEKEERDSTHLAARRLVKEGYGVRDAGAVLNLSYQRVQQIVGKRTTQSSARRVSSKRNLKP